MADPPLSQKGNNQSAATLFLTFKTVTLVLIFKQFFQDSNV